MTPSGELLSRFSFHHRDIRDDGTVRKELFMPPRKSAEVSVIRHDVSTDVLWPVGQKIANIKGIPVRGSAECVDHQVVAVGLEVEASPSRISEKHANIIGWKDDKFDRIQKAEQLAMCARFVSVPQSLTETEEKRMLVEQPLLK